MVFRSRALVLSAESKSTSEVLAGKTSSFATVSATGVKSAAGVTKSVVPAQSPNTSVARGVCS